MAKPKVKPRRDELPSADNLCDFCTAKCCRYFALPMDTPTTRKDFDFLRWFLLHGRASIFTEGEIWYMLVHTECKHLQPDNRCGIYETRPQICRTYSTVDCEYEDDWTYERYFETPEQVEEYMDAVFSKPTPASTRSPRPALLPVLS